MLYSILVCCYIYAMLFVEYLRVIQEIDKKIFLQKEIFRMWSHKQATKVFFLSFLYRFKYEFSLSVYEIILSNSQSLK